MIEKSKKVLLAFLFSFSANAFAGWSSGSVGISSIEIADGGANILTYIVFANDPFPSHTCSSKSGSYLLSGNQEYVKNAYAAALAARTAGKTVRVLWNGCSNAGVPIISGILY